MTLLDVIRSKNATKEQRYNLIKWIQAEKEYKNLTEQEKIIADIFIKS